MIESSKRILAGMFLVIGIVFTLLALGVFAMSLIAALTHNYEGGEAVGAFIFYGLLALPAFGFTTAAIWVRGWCEARAGYITLACLFGIPLLTFIAAVIQAVYDSFHHTPTV